MTKEIVIKNALSRKAALSRLRLDFQNYRKARGIKAWRWLVAPEALSDGKTWRAYGRMVTSRHQDKAA